MKYLHKYNKYSYIIENKSTEDESSELLHNLVDIMSEFIDDGRDVQFESLFGRISVNDFLNKNEEKLEEFKPVFKAGNKIKSLFRIFLFINPRCEYEEFANIVSDMISGVGRVKDMGWLIGKFEQFQDESGKFTTLSYTFTKPDIKTDSDIPVEDEIIKQFEFFGLKVEEIEYDGNIINVGAESFNYDGEIPSDIEDKLDRMIQKFGFDFYEHETHQGNTWLSVRFWVDDLSETED